MRKQFIVAELSTSCCDYEYIEVFDTKEEAETFIKEHQHEYSGRLAIVK